MLRDPRQTMYEVLESNKNGLLLSDCVEQKAVPGMVSWRKRYLHVDIFLDSRIRVCYLDSPHKSSNAFLTKPQRSVSLFHSDF